MSEYSNQLVELIDFSKKLKNIMVTSEVNTRAIVDSIDSLNFIISDHKTGMESIFVGIEAKKKRINNLDTTVKELDDFYRLIHIIDTDKLQVMQGPRGSLGEYIEKLECVRGLEKYSWLKQEAQQSVSSSSSLMTTAAANGSVQASDKTPSVLHRVVNKSIARNNTSNMSQSYFQACYFKYTTLMSHGEKCIMQEFKDVLKHYSSVEQMQSFIDFLINKSNEDNNISNSNNYISNNNGNLDASNSAVSQTASVCNAISSDLFMPCETIGKLEQICWWFLQREQQYELYDEKGNHCDINQKLRFSEYRIEFLKLCLKTYSRMNSLGFKKDGTFKRSISKLFNAATSQMHDTLSAGGGGSGNSTTAAMQNIDLSSSTSFKSTNVLSPSVVAIDTAVGSVDVKSSRPVEFIQLFVDNLDFSLKLLQDENALITSIYYKSPETRIELISKLTILIIDHIQNEFELFFTNALDFSKLGNCDDSVIESIIQLIIKVQNLKEKTGCLQTEDLSSASKLLQFSMKLNEISAQIFASYLETLRTGHLNTYDMPMDCSAHAFVLKACEICRYINVNETYLHESIKMAVMTSMDHHHHVSKAQQLTVNAASVLSAPIVIIGNQIKSGYSNSKTASVKHRFQKFGQKNVSLHKDPRENRISPVDGEKNENEVDDELALEAYQRSRRSRGVVEHKSFQEGDSSRQVLNPPLSDSANYSNSSGNTNDEFEGSYKWYFAKYYSFIFDNLDSFLIDEAIKSVHQINNQNQQWANSSNNSSNTFKSHLRSMKTYLFLLNNLSHLVDVTSELKLYDLILKTNSDFENQIKEGVENNIDGACDLFRYLNAKWKKLSMSLEWSQGDDVVTLSVNVGQKAASVTSMTQYKSTNSQVICSKDTIGHRNGTTANRFFKNPFVDSKKKRFDDLFQMLTETVENCFKIPILDKMANQLLKRKVQEQLDPIMEMFESSNFLKDMIESLNVNRPEISEINSKEIIYRNMFPYKST